MGVVLWTFDLGRDGRVILHDPKVAFLGFLAQGQMSQGNGRGLWKTRYPLVLPAPATPVGFKDLLDMLVTEDVVLRGGIAARVYESDGNRLQRVRLATNEFSHCGSTLEEFSQSSIVRLSQAENSETKTALVYMTETFLS